MVGISERAKNCHASATLGISAKAQAMKKEGKDVVNFGAGQPDFEPPEILKQAAIDAINQKGTGKYTPASGLPELKKVICEKFKKDNNIEYDVKNISINVGAKHTIYNILQALVNTGDEVIIPKPFWVSYPEMVSLADGKSVFIETDKEYKLTASDVKKAITDKTKVLILNSPSNPSGAVIDENELREIANLAVENQFYVISDEIYEKIIYDAKHISIGSFNDHIKNLTFSVNGISKSLAVPGWRLGYVGGPENEIKAINCIQSHSTSNPCSIVQQAAIKALNNSEVFVNMAVKEFKNRRDFIVKALNDISGVECPTPGGAFYVFPKLPIKDDWEFTNKLLDEKYVAVVPGKEFGMEGYARLSYATDMESIKKGVERIKEFLDK